MTVEFACPHCGQLLREPDANAGQAAACPHCRAALTVPVEDNLAWLREGVVGHPAPVESVEHESTAGFQDSDNPFRAPLEITPAGRASLQRGKLKVASRANRFCGALIDSSIAVAAAVATMVWAPFEDQDLDAWPGIAAVMLVQWTLITLSGQSIGKKLLGTQIVVIGPRGKRGVAGFWNGVILRSLVPNAIGAFCGIFSLVDALSIFSGADNECLHDLIAKTRVVYKEQPGEVAEPSDARRNASFASLQARRQNLGDSIGFERLVSQQLVS